jgi:hypothetical protein
MLQLGQMLPALRFKAPTETSLTAVWDACGEPLLLVVREFPHPWESARVIVLPAGGGHVAEHVVRGLMPQTAYEMRLSLAGPDARPVGEPGRAVSADTAAVGCTPKAEGRGQHGCAIA